MRHGLSAIKFRGGSNFQRSDTSLPEGGGAPALPNFGGFFSVYAFVAELPNLTGQHVVGVYLEVSHSSHPKREEFQHSPILRVLHIGPV